MKHKEVKPLFFICETPLHVGTGSDLGIVDLPIQRERHTHFPKVEGSSLKGALRRGFEELVASTEFNDFEQPDTKIQRFFGFDDGGLSDEAKKNLQETWLHKVNKNKVASDFASALDFTDARILLFPVKSMQGVFAWVTCPRVMSQFAADLKLMGQSIPEIPEFETCLVPEHSDLTLKNQSDAIVLEEYYLEAQASAEWGAFCNWLSTQLLDDSPSYWKKKMTKSIVCLSDSDFEAFVRLSTEIITRNKIDNQTGTVAEGALFSEEYLPAESVLYALVIASPEHRQDGASRGEVMGFFEENYPKVMQLGGNATIGKGIIRTKLGTTKSTDHE